MERAIPNGSVGFLQSSWEKPIWEGVWPHFDPMDSVYSRTASMEWHVPGKYGPHGELFLFPIQNEPARTPDGQTFSAFIIADIRTPFFSADVLSKCAFVALHIIAEEGRNGEVCHVPGLGDEWEMGCPNSPMWESGDEAWSEDQSLSSDGSREDNVCNEALHVIGLCGPVTRSPFS